MFVTFCTSSGAGEGSCPVRVVNRASFPSYYSDFLTGNFSNKERAVCHAFIGYTSNGQLSGESHTQSSCPVSGTYSLLLSIALKNRFSHYKRLDC